MKAYYFGCESKQNKGHFLYRPWQPGYMCLSASREQREELPWGDGELDSGLAPQIESQPQGLCKLHHKDGWTALAFWDRSADSRGNSNSVIIAEGAHSFLEMLLIFAENFPVVRDRVVAEMTLTELVKQDQSSGAPDGI
jgi:hypothetical protein